MCVQLFLCPYPNASPRPTGPFRTGVLWFRAKDSTAELRYRNSSHLDTAVEIDFLFCSLFGYPSHHRSIVSVLVLLLTPTLLVLVLHFAPTLLVLVLHFVPTLLVLVLHFAKTLLVLVLLRTPTLWVLVLLLTPTLLVLILHFAPTRSLFVAGNAVRS